METLVHGLTIQEQANLAALQSQLGADAFGSHDTLSKKDKTDPNKREFRLDLYTPETQEQIIREDIASYLGEYRYRVREYGFNLYYSQGANGQVSLRDDKGQVMVEVGERAIQDRVKGGGGLYKVSADLKGIKRQQELLRNARNGDLLIYGSPPDQQAGYTYGFVYIGKVRETSQGKMIAMRAIRVNDGTTLDQFNQALSDISGKPIAHSTPNDFIENPELVAATEREMDNVMVNAILRSYFQYADVPQEAAYMQYMQHDPNLLNAIAAYVALVRQGASLEEKGELFDVIENYAEETWEKLLDETITVVPVRRGIIDTDSTPLNTDKVLLDMVVMQNMYGYKPKVVSGTCPNENGRKSGDIFGFDGLFRGLSGLREPSLEDYKNDPNLCRCGGLAPHFHCPTDDGGCGTPIIVGEGTEKCKCGKGKTC